MEESNLYYDLVSLLGCAPSEKKPACRQAGAQVLRSFGKQCEAKLPTSPLIINEVSQKCAE